MRIVDLSTEQLLQKDRVVISSNGGGGHAICIVGQGQSVRVHDPLHDAPSTWIESKLRTRYRGPVIVIERIRAG